MKKGTNTALAKGNWETNLGDNWIVQITAKKNKWDT